MPQLCKTINGLHRSLTGLAPAELGQALMRDPHIDVYARRIRQTIANVHRCHGQSALVVWICLDDSEQTLFPCDHLPDVSYIVRCIGKRLSNLVRYRVMVFHEAGR